MKPIEELFKEVDEALRHASQASFSALGSRQFNEEARVALREIAERWPARMTTDIDTAMDLRGKVKEDDSQRRAILAALEKKDAR